MAILILMVMLFQISSKTAIGNRVVYDDKFVVIEGKINLAANTSEWLANDQWNFTSKTINYPNGFNKTNCVVIGFGCTQESFYDNKGYSYGDRSGGNVFSTVMALCDVPRNATLYADGIHISVGNYATSEKTFIYKIVLMKVDPDVSDYELGDVNMDGQVTMEDATLLQDFVAGRQDLTDKQIKLGDMDDNGVISLTDVYDIISKVNEQNEQS